MEALYFRPYITVVLRHVRAWCFSATIAFSALRQKKGKTKMNNTTFKTKYEPPQFIKKRIIVNWENVCSLQWKNRYMKQIKSRILIYVQNKTKKNKTKRQIWCKHASRQMRASAVYVQAGWVAAEFWQWVNKGFTPRGTRLRWELIWAAVRHGALWNRKKRSRRPRKLKPSYTLGWKEPGMGYSVTEERCTSLPRRRIKPL